MLRSAFCFIFIAFISLTLTKKPFTSSKEFVSNFGSKKMQKLTTCEEFLNGSKLNITALLNLNWKVFYYWNVQFQKVTDDIVKFYLPSKILLKRLKMMMSGPASPQVEWDKAELHLENMAWGGNKPQQNQESVTALLIRVNETSGLYRVVPTTTFDFDNVDTDYFLALKLVDGYLGMMNCQMHIVSALAPLRKIPTRDMLELVADKFNITSFERWPYLYEPKMTSPKPSFGSANDVDSAFPGFPEDDTPDFDIDPQNMQII